MAFADFGDWDWTEHAADDGEQADDSKKGLAVSAYPVLAFSFYHEYLPPYHHDVTAKAYINLGVCKTVTQ